MTPSPALRRVVLAGGSVAAVTAADALRGHCFDGEITLLSDEVYAPYSRVPLSKGVLSGKETPDSTALPALAEVSVRLGARIARLLTDRQRVVLSDGEEVPYDGLLIATGAHARRLSKPGQRGECVVRTLGASAVPVTPSSVCTRTRACSALDTSPEANRSGFR